MGGRLGPVFYTMGMEVAGEIQQGAPKAADLVTESPDGQWDPLQRLGDPKRQMELQYGRGWFQTIVLSAEIQRRVFGWGGHFGYSWPTKKGYVISMTQLNHLFSIEQENDERSMFLILDTLQKQIVHLINRAIHKMRNVPFSSFLCYLSFINWESKLWLIDLGWII